MLDGARRQLLLRKLLGPELVVNGGFDPDLTGWTVTASGTSTLTATGGGARFNNPNNDITALVQAILKPGHRYMVGFDIIEAVSGSLKVEKSGGSSFFTVSAVGSYRFLFGADITNLSIRRVAACDITIDNVTVREIL